MCYFMCLAVPGSVGDVSESFDASVALDPADGMPIGKVVKGGERDSAYLVTVNGCSCDLFRGGHKMDAKPELILDGVRHLLRQVPELAVLVHWFTDYPDKQEVCASANKNLTLAQLSKSIASLEEDTRYTITP